MQKFPPSKTVAFSFLTSYIYIILLHPMDSSVCWAVGLSDRHIKLNFHYLNCVQVPKFFIPKLSVCKPVLRSQGNLAGP